MQVPVKDLKGAEVESIELNDAVFGLPMNKSVVYQAILRQRANARQGTSDTKRRGEVSGSGKKPFPQKHTGRARSGDKRGPLWRHGGIVFGPHQRDYSQDLPKKMRRLAIKCVLSDKVRNNEMVVLKDLLLNEGKTKEMADILRSLELNGSMLVVTAEADVKVVKSARNLSRVKTLPAAVLNVGDLLQNHYLVITADAVGVVEGILSKPVTRRHTEGMQIAIPAPKRKPRSRPATKPRTESRPAAAETKPRSRPATEPRTESGVAAAEPKPKSTRAATGGKKAAAAAEVAATKKRVSRGKKS